MSASKNKFTSSVHPRLDRSLNRSMHRSMNKTGGSWLERSMSKSKRSTFQSTNHARQDIQLNQEYRDYASSKRRSSPYLTPSKKMGMSATNRSMVSNLARSPRADLNMSRSWTNKSARSPLKVTEELQLIKALKT